MVMSFLPGEINSLYPLLVHALDAFSRFFLKMIPIRCTGWRFCLCMRLRLHLIKA